MDAGGDEQPRLWGGVFLEAALRFGALHSQGWCPCCPAMAAKPSCLRALALQHFLSGLSPWLFTPVGDLEAAVHPQCQQGRYLDEERMGISPAMLPNCAARSFRRHSTKNACVLSTLQLLDLQTVEWTWPTSSVAIQHECLDTPEQWVCMTICRWQIWGQAAQARTGSCSGDSRGWGALTVSTVHSAFIALTVCSMAAAPVSYCVIHGSASLTLSVSLVMSVSLFR